MTFVFLGAYSQVLGAGILLTRFGQRVELPPDLADETRLDGGLPCIPADQFDALGFTAAELKKYAVAATHEGASAEFLAKKAKALELLHKIRIDTAEFLRAAVATGDESREITPNLAGGN